MWGYTTQRKAEGKVVFITVGSTKFDKLCHECLSPSFIEAIKKLGFTKIIMQDGYSRNIYGGKLNPDPVRWMLGLGELKIFHFDTGIEEYIKEADVVISHAGAGTCLEVLRMKKRLLVVPNHDLRGNHQQELADELSKNNFVIQTTPEKVTEDLKRILTCKLAQFPDPNEAKFENIFDDALVRVTPG